MALVVWNAWPALVALVARSRFRTHSLHKLGELGRAARMFPWRHRCAAAGSTCPDTRSRSDCAGRTGASGMGSCTMATAIPRLRFTVMMCSLRSTTLRAVRSAPIQMTMLPGRAVVAARSPSSGPGKIRDPWAVADRDAVGGHDLVHPRDGCADAAGGHHNAGFGRYRRRLHWRCTDMCGLQHYDMTMCSWRWRIVRGRGLSSRVQPRACPCHPLLCTAAFMRARTASVLSGRTSAKLRCSTL